MQAWPGIRPIALLVVAIVLVWIALVVSRVALPPKDEPSRALRVAQEIAHERACERGRSSVDV